MCQLKKNLILRNKHFLLKPPSKLLRKKTLPFLCNLSCTSPRDHRGGYNQNFTFKVKANFGCTPPPWSQGRGCNLTFRLFCGGFVRKTPFLRVLEVLYSKQSCQKNSLGPKVFSRKKIFWLRPLLGPLLRRELKEPFPKKTLKMACKDAVEKPCYVWETKLFFNSMLQVRQSFFVFFCFIFLSKMDQNTFQNKAAT